MPFLRKRFYSKILDQRFTVHLYLYLLGLWTGASSNWPVRQFVCKTIVIPLQYLSGGSKGMIQSDSRLFGVSMIWLSHDCLCQPLPPPPDKVMTATSHKSCIVMRYFIFLYNCHHLRSYNDRLQGTFTCMSSDFLLWFSLWENKVNLTHLFIIIQRKRQLIMTWTRLWKRSLPKAVSFGAVYWCSLLFHGRIPSHSEILHDNFDRNINNFSPRNYTSV